MDGLSRRPRARRSCREEEPRGPPPRPGPPRDGARRRLGRRRGLAQSSWDLGRQLPSRDLCRRRPERGDGGRRLLRARRIGPAPGSLAGRARRAARRRRVRERRRDARGSIPGVPRRTVLRTARPRVLVRGHPARQVDARPPGSLERRHRVPGRGDGAVRDSDRMGPGPAPVPGEARRLRRFRGRRRGLHEGPGVPRRDLSQRPRPTESRSHVVPDRRGGRPAFSGDGRLSEGRATEGPGRLHPRAPLRRVAVDPARDGLRAGGDGLRLRCLGGRPRRPRRARWCDAESYSWSLGMPLPSPRTAGATSAAWRSSARFFSSSRSCSDSRSG